MLLAEELLLQLTRPDGTPLRDPDVLGLATAGAMLLELHERGRVDIDDRGRLTTSGEGTTGSPLLDEALAVFRQRTGRRPKNVLPKFAKAARLGTYHSLAARGLVREDRGRVLGLFSRTLWPLMDAAAVEEARAELATVLVGQVAPDRRTGALIALLSAVDVVPKLFAGAGELSKRELTARAKAISDGAWAPEAVRKAIADANAAVTAAIIAATSAATVSSGS